MKAPRTWCSRIGFRVCGGVGVGLLLGLLVVAAGMPAGAANANFHLDKTVTRASDSPVLGLTLAVDRSTAIPRDTLTYTAVVSNTGSLLSLAGDLTVQNTEATAATVAYYSDVISTAANSHCGAGGDNNGQNTTPQWSPLVGTAAAADGYTPVQPAQTSAGIRLTVTPVPAAGVTYPASGDPIVGTRIAPGAQATWHYTATVALTPAQTAFLLDPAQVSRIRNTFHAEPAPRAQGGQGSPATVDVDFCQQLFSPQPSSAASNVTVTITPPAGGASTFNASSVPALASLPSGGSVTVSTPWAVPFTGSRQAGETDAGYLARLAALEGARLSATATASGTASSGPISAPPATSGVTIEHLPILGIAKSGPATADAGTTATYAIALANSGGATASGLTVSDSVAGGGTGTVSGVPASISPAGAITVAAIYAIPASQPAGPLTDAAAVTWRDANGDLYGPISSAFTTQVRQATPAAAISSGPVEGNFFFRPSTATAFNAKPGDIPAFRQTFPTLNFNPPPGVVNHDTSGVGPTTRPFTDVTTDGAGNFASTIVAQGNGLQAGVGTLSSFDAVFTGSFVVAKAGDVTFNVLANDGFLFGVGGGATRVSGSYEGAPASNASRFQAYPLVGAWNQPSGGAVGTYPVTVHFPAAGTYPYEIDYFDCCGQPLSLTLAVAKFTADTSALSVYVGYADGLRPAGSTFPFPWQGSPNVNFYGSGATAFDAGAIRFDNSSDDPIVFNDVSVDIGPFHWDLWGNHIVVPPHGIAILTQTNGENFDTSDAPATCNPTGYIPEIHVTQAGVVTTYKDTQQILNTQGIDPANCGGLNEAHAWERIGGGGVGISVPLPPTVTMSLSPATSPGQTVGSTQTLTVAVLDVGGQPVPGLEVAIGVFGANTQTLRATTDADGVATASYTGLAAGTDNITATAFVSGLRAVSNSLHIEWAAVSPPAVQGWIGAPLDGSTATGTVPVTVGTGVTLTQGTVAYWPASNPSGVTVLATGVQGGPGATLATLDTTLLANGNYVISLQATDSNGQQLVSQVTITVTGENKPGRMTLSVTDLTVPVTGIPITITRRYDSLERNQVGDFGYGWSLELAGPRLEVSSNYDVTITEPGTGRRVTFQFAPTSFAFPFTFLYQPTYLPEPGVYGKLASDGCDLLIPSSGGGVTCYLSSDPTYRPTTYTYTDPYGRVYTMTAAGKMQSIQDLNGNVLSFSAAGISSSVGGLNVPFVRDARGRITQITDPNGKTFRYNYDAAGDLVGVQLPETETPLLYEYASGHFFLKGTDARGNTEATTTYYADGRLQSVTDAMGKTTGYDYDLATNTTTITHPDNTGTTIESYDASGLLLSTTDPLGRTISYTYDANHNKRTETDALGKTTTFDYDANGHLKSVTDPLNNTQLLTNNEFGQPLSATDQLGKIRTLTYDANQNLSTFSDEVGTLMALTWSEHGNPLTLADANGKVAHFTYDAYGNILSKTDPLGHTTSYTYDAMGRALTMTDARGVTRFSYDAVGRMLSVVDPLSNETRYEYDANSNRTAVIDARNHTTRYEYDAANRVSKIIYPDGVTHSYTYNFRGQKETETVAGPDTDARTTTYLYDNAGQLVKVVNPDQSEIKRTYDEVGRIKTVTDELNKTVTYEYDPNCGCRDRLAKITDQSGNATTYTYDAAGRRISFIDAANRETRYAYDVRNRLTKTTFADSTFTETTFDGIGHPLTSTDQEGRVTRYAYDEVGNLLSVTNPQNATTQYAYDALKNLLSLTDANNHTTRFEYDALNRLVKRVLPLGMAELYTYDQVGNRVTRTDFRGKQTSYEFDPMNRLTARRPDPSLGEPTVLYSYTGTGARRSMTDASGTTTYTYDQRDRLLTKQTPQGTLTYTYNLVGKLTSMRSSNAGGVSVDYTYDDLQRLGNVVDNQLAAGTTTYTYDVVGNLKSDLRPNGLRADYTYSALNRLTDLGITRGGVTQASYTYTLDRTGRRLSVTESSGRTVNYTYDVAYRLTQEAVSGVPNSAGNGVVDYAYDLVGNRLSRISSLEGVLSATSAYDAGDRLLSDAYDANGNTINADGRAYAYDFENRVKSSNNGAVSIKYDGDGNLAAKTVNGVTTQYLVDDLNPTGYSQVVEEIVNGQVQQQYTYGNTIISQRRRLASGWAVNFYSTDGHGSVRQLTDETGAVTDTYTYDAFGKLISRTGTTPNPYLYAGERFDADLGLYYLRARYYNADRGRFFSMDPYPGGTYDPASLHKYLYAHADPINFTDPSGLSELIDTAIILRANLYLAARLVVKRAASAAIATAVRALITRVAVDEFLSSREVCIGLVALKVIVNILEGPYVEVSTGAADQTLDALIGAYCGG